MHAPDAQDVDFVHLAALSKSAQWRLRMRSSIAAAGFAALAFAASADAATYVPTRFDDPAPNGCLPTDCSLREAVMAANASVGFDLIQLSPGTYVLTRSSTYDSPAFADLDVTDAVRIFSTGTSADTRIHNLLAELPGREARVIEAWGMARFELQGVTLRYGRMHSTNVCPWGGCLLVDSLPNAPVPRLIDVVMIDCKVLSGGGMLALGPVRLDRVQVRNNRAYVGGGLWQAGGVSSWRRVVIAGNEADYLGGGLLVDGAGSTTTTIDTDAASGITGNQALNGGGIGVRSPNVLLLRGPAAASAGGMLHVEDNLADRGGGAWVESGSALELHRIRFDRNEAAVGGAVGSESELHLFDSEPRANTAGLRGGGIYSIGSVAEFRRLSLTGNQAQTGAGMYVENASSLRLENLSIHDNRAQEGGGLYFQALLAGGLLRNVSMHANVALAGDGSDGLQLIGSTLQLAANWMGDGCALVNSSVLSLGGNAQRSGTSSCGLQASDIGDLTAAEASVSQAWYGGRFDIVGFVSGNSALEDRVAASTCATDDARGFLRTQRSCDVGAYEAAGVAP
jgi:hypothetical protein